MSIGAEWQAASWFRKGIGHDALRAELRAAIVQRDARLRAVDDAQAELARMRVVEAEARATLATLDAGLDAERDAARTAAIRAGSPALDSPAITARLALREEARTLVADGERAVAAVAAEVATAQGAQRDAQAGVEALAAALVATKIECLADRLVEAEKAAEAIRAIVSATAGTYLAQGFTKAFPLPVSERTKGLLGCTPVNALPRADVPAFRVADEKTRQAFRSHAAALLNDADAPLATALGERNR